MPFPPADTAADDEPRQHGAAVSAARRDHAALPGVRRDIPGPLDIDQAAQAERTVVALQHALSVGLPIMVPGGLGARRATPTPIVYPELAAVFDRRRDEHEWEGGGAPEARGAALPVGASWRRRLYRMLGL